MTSPATCSGLTENQGTGATSPGLGPVGYGGNTLNNITVNVLDGATVTGTNGGLSFGTGLTVDNRGTITTSSGSGISAGSIITLNNSYSISGGAAAIAVSGGSIGQLNNGAGATIVGGNFGVFAASIGDLVNGGRIAGGSAAIFMTGSIQTLTNTATGTIESTTSGTAISAGAFGAIDNAGKIAGVSGAITTAGRVESLRNAATGSISGTGNFGVQAASIGSVDNAGEIHGGLNGIFVQTGSLESLSNASTGVISGTGSSGINARNIGTVYNRGTISGNNDAIFSGTNLASLVNEGSIFATGGGGAAVLVNGTIDKLDNSGTILNALQLGVAAGNINQLTNSGEIRGGSGAISAFGTLQSLTNSGTILSTGPDVIAASSIGTLTNAGLISGAFMYAIRESGAADTTLNLNAGSVIIGRIDLGGGTNVLNVGPGLSINNTFDDGAPVIGRTSGAYAVNGNRVAVVDPTNLANHTEMLVDLTDNIFSTLQGRFSGLSVGYATAPSSGAFAAPMNLGARPASADAIVQKEPRISGQYWAQAFASHRGQEGSSTTTSSEQQVSGFVSGFDAPVSRGTVAGFFGGGAWGDSKADFASQSTDAESYFGGAYLSASFGATSFDVALVGGRSTFDRDRRIANNTLPTGLEFASAEYNGWFISPEARLTERLRLGGQKIEASLSARYAGLFLDGFTETGATDGLSIASRDLHLGVARATLALPLEHAGNGWLARLTLAGGIEGRTQIGDAAATGVLLGQGIAFEAGDDAAIGVFAGATAEVVTAGGASVFAQLEGLAEDDGSQRFGGKAGVRLPF